MEFPFKETHVGGNTYIREFKSDVKTNELEWHVDREDRIIEVVKNTNWKLQMDNQLPITLHKTVYIPKETYHRVIKGNGSLVIKVTKLQSSD